MSVDVTLAPPRAVRGGPEGDRSMRRGSCSTTMSDPLGLLAGSGCDWASAASRWRCRSRDGVMACLGAKALPGVDLLFADTGYHFAETQGTA